MGTLLREVRSGLRRLAVFIALYHLWCSGHERKLADAVVYIPAERVETVSSLARHAHYPVLVVRPQNGTDSSPSWRWFSTSRSAGGV